MLRKIFMVIEFLIGLACLVYYFICYIRFGQVSFLVVWLILGCAILMLVLVKMRFSDSKKWIYVLTTAVDAVFVAGVMVTVIFFVCILRDSESTAPANCDVMIVLGAAVNKDQPSEILENRIQVAYEYLINNPDTKVVCSGGQGVGDKISEGACIANQLIDMGINPDRIKTETKAKTTVENLKFSLKKIDSEPDTVVVVTSGFHVFRSEFILSKFTDAKIYGIGGKGGGMLMPHYMLREEIVFFIDFIYGNYSHTNNASNFF